MITKYGDGTTIPWGLDRIDNIKLPLNNVYNHQYTGYNVDVYIVDTGIDTSHNEFQPLPGQPSREVRNIYSAFTNNLANDIDGQGHGTHVAGTVGGKYVGVAPLANIFGVQVLNKDGEGDTSDIVHALEFVLNNARTRGRRSVVSMSLGGQCDSNDCKDDMLVIASEYLSHNNIIVVVAAGNDACNACQGSPNAAASAINVGAINENDQVAYFSNYGQCVDVFSPGFDIISACAHTLCGDENYYIPLSGTSMAAPHVTGVVAQILQKDNTATVDDIVKYINCDGSRSNLKLNPIDTISKNLILQVPKNDDNKNCDLGLGCLNDCSSQGICLPIQHTNNVTCYCNAGYFGNNCGYTSDPYCFNKKNMTANFYDFLGDGWNYANFWISDSSTGEIVDNVLDSLCSSSMESHDYCIPQGCYDINVSRGNSPDEVAFSFCDMMGSAPYTGKFCVDDSGNCKQTCDGALRNMTLLDSYGDGWDGAYYSITNKDGKQLFGGALPDSSEWSYEICLPVGCSTLLIETNDKDPDEVFFHICGVTASYHEIVILCVDDNHNCIASNGLSSNASCNSNNIPIYLFDRDTNGWNGQQYRIVNDQGQNVVQATMTSGFSSITSACLQDGCYDLVVGNTLTTQPNEFWSTCGYRGTVPWSSKICVEQKYGLCYGLSGCHYFKSYMHESDLQRYIIYDPSSYNRVIDLNNIHGVNDMCTLSDGCYQVFVGAGKSMSGSSEIEICNQMITIPAIVNFCSSNNGTTCSIQSHRDLSCSASNSHKTPIPIVMIDTFGDGWLEGMGKFLIKDINNNIVFQGSLKSGFFGVETSCLQVGFDYGISVSARQYGDEMAVVLCGAAKAVGNNMLFSVTATGCVFHDADDDKYFGTVDDDFPVIAAPSPQPVPVQGTNAPSPQPTQGTNAPTLKTTLPVTTPVQVVSIAMNITTKISFFNSNQVLTPTDFYFLVLGVRRVLDLNGYAVWSIYLNGMTVLYSDDSTKIIMKAFNINRRKTLSSSAVVSASININYFVTSDQHIDANTLSLGANNIQNYLQDEQFQTSVDTVLSATVTMTEIKSSQILKVESTQQPYVQTYNLSSQPLNEYQNIYDKIWPPNEDTNIKKQTTLPIYIIATITVISLLLIIIVCIICRNRKKITITQYTSLNISKGNVNDNEEKQTAKNEVNTSSSSSSKSSSSASKTIIKSKLGNIKVNKVDITTSSNPIHNSYAPVSIQVTDIDDDDD